MNRRELAYVLIRLTALSFFFQALIVAPYLIDLASFEGGMQSLAFRQVLSGLIRFAACVGLWVGSPKLAQMVAND